MEVREPNARYLVKPAFKQTEVGVIPDDWEVRRLGGVLSKGRLGGNYANQDTITDFPLMKMGNVARGCFDVTKVEFIAPKVLPEQEHLLKYGDVLFNTRNSLDLVGKVAIWRNELPVAYYNSNLMRLEFDSKIVGSTEYANYAFNTASSVARLRALATGTTSVAAIYTRDLLELLFVVPPLAEQHAIAEALSDADALIESLEQLLAKKRQIKQGAMQELLTGQKRLPGFAGEWNDISLGLLGEFLKGSGITRDQAQSGVLPCIRYGEIYTAHNDCVRVFCSWISAEVARTATRLKQGDLLFAGSGETKEDIGKCVAFTDDVEAYAGGDIVILRPCGCDSHFLGYLLNTAGVARQKASRGQGDAVVHIGAKALAEISIRIPEIREQTAIVTILSDLDAELAVLETKLTKARQIKQGMMQELLTGRIRLV